MKIGLTGGVATGKSTAAQMLKELGAPVIDADKINHQLLASGTEVWSKVVDCFGEEILTSGGEIDRQKLGSIVFDSSEAREKLEAITHPYIIKELKQRMEETLATSPVVVAEVPLLIEADLMDLFNRIWVVYADREVQISRLKERNGYDRKTAQSRIAAQLDLEKKLNYADRVIDNTGSRQDLEEKVERAWQEINREIKK